jgi:hypothetical protein
VSRDAWARDVLRRVWPSSWPRPTLAELQAVQAVGRHEGFYGFASSPPQWAGSNNWGAIQAPRGADDSTSFEAGDTHPDGTAYTARFKRYPTPEAGALDLVRELYRRPTVRAAARAGDLSAMALAMRQTGYHESPPARYAAALDRNARAIAGALGEQLAARPGGAGGTDVVLFVLAIWGLWRLTR